MRYRRVLSVLVKASEMHIPPWYWFSCPPGPGDVFPTSFAISGVLAMLSLPVWIHLGIPHLLDGSHNGLHEANLRLIPSSWPPDVIGLGAARLTSGDHLGRYIEYPEVRGYPRVPSCRGVAQWPERWSLEPEVGGSSPPAPAKLRSANRPAMVSAVARSPAPASVIASRVLGLGSPHLKQGAVSWAM